jgi:hypothetical protein
MLRARITGIIGLTIVLILVACRGGVVGQPTPSPVIPVSLGYDQSPEALIIETDTYGGLMPPPISMHVPDLRIYGDGLVVRGEEGESSTRGLDRRVMTGHLGEEELDRLVSFIAGQGFFQLEDRYMPSPAPTDLPSRHITVNLLDVSKTVSIYPFDFADAPAAFWDVYNELMAVAPSDEEVFIPTSGTMTPIELGPIDDLPSGQRNQVAPWDTPLVGISLPEATEGVYLEGEEYQVIDEFLLRYPPHQVFGSQEGGAYQVRLEGHLPWGDSSP